MRKSLKRITACAMLAASVWTLALVRDRKTLKEELIRFHVVANSDTQADQQLKLQVRDAVIESLRSGLEQVADVEEAKRYLQTNLPKIQQTAQRVLVNAGISQECVVTLSKEAFDTRFYDTFSLPAGVYESLRIVIGQGKGHNWWCVSFPGLCIPDTAEGFSAVAAGAGFTKALTGTLAEEYKIRFFFLEQLGKLENMLFEG